MGLLMEKSHSFFIQFIKEGYENPNYAKSVENDGYDTWVKFEPLQDKFPLNV